MYATRLNPPFQGIELQIKKPANLHFLAQLKFLSRIELRHLGLGLVLDFMNWCAPIVFFTLGVNYDGCADLLLLL